MQGGRVSAVLVSQEECEDEFTRQAAEDGLASIEEGNEEEEEQEGAEGPQSPVPMEEVSPKRRRTGRSNAGLAPVRMEEEAASRGTTDGGSVGDVYRSSSFIKCENLKCTTYL